MKEGAKESQKTGLVLSVILPVFNVEAYLERCIRSLEDQDVPKNSYEIIVVNDGSPDNSREVVLKLMKEFNNIVFIEQENKGVSLARNAGIDKAQGRYLLFVDPDDYVFPQSFGSVINKAIESDAEVAFLGYNFLDVNGTCVAEILHLQLKGATYSGIDAYFLSRGDGKTDPDRSVAILYERNFMDRNSLRYVSKIPYLEDGEFIARVFCVAKSCIFTGIQFYLRTTRPGSATNSDLFYQDRAVQGFERAVLNLVNFRSHPGHTHNQRIFLNQPICKFFTLVLIPSCRIFKYGRFRSSVKRLREIGFNRVDTEGCNNYYKLEGFLYNTAPFFFYLHRVLHAPLLKLINP